MRSSAWAEVVGGPPGCDLHVAAAVRLEQLDCHAASQFSLLGVRVVCAVFGEGMPVGSAVHVDVLHAHQSGAVRAGGVEHRALHRGELLDPLRVRRVECLVDHCGSRAGCGSEFEVASVATDYLDAVRDSG